MMTNCAMNTIQGGCGAYFDPALPTHETVTTDSPSIKTIVLLTVSSAYLVLIQLIRPAFLKSINDTIIRG